MDELQRLAQIRVRFLLWLADRLEKSDHPEYRKEAAQALRQMAGL